MRGHIKSPDILLGSMKIQSPYSGGYGSKTNINKFVDQKFGQNE
jgi:hypothetical protein